MTDPQHPVKSDPRVPISAADLAAIVASHDRLQTWNDRNEQALSAGGKHPDLQVVKNIQSTAALILRNEMVVSSQNFELMRAMNLFDRTLSSAEMAQGFVEGSWNELQKMTGEALSFTHPSDMNLQHSQARVDALLNAPLALADAARPLLQHPPMIPQALQQAIEAHLTKSVVLLAENMSDTNPSHVIGAALGAAATAMVIGSLNPAGKGNTLAMTAEKVADKPLDWHEYATLLGAGSYPPPVRPSRDFTDLMKIKASDSKYENAYVSYIPSKLHKIEMYVYPYNGMSFLIRAMDDKEKYGSGTELFLNAVEKLRRQGIDISRLKDNWKEGELQTNWQQFMDAYHAGASPEQAFKRTFSGRMAGRLGLTSVEMQNLDWELASASPTLRPVFTRPDWGKDPAWNDYAKAWVSSQGRPSLELTPRGDTGEVARSVSAIPAELLRLVERLPISQQDTILKQLEDQFSKHDNPSKSTITRIDEPGSER